MVQIVRANLIYVESKDLPPAMLNRLLRLAEQVDQNHTKVTFAHQSEIGAIVAAFGGASDTRKEGRFVLFRAALLGDSLGSGWGNMVPWKRASVITGGLIILYWGATGYLSLGIDSNTRFTGAILILIGIPGLYLGLTQK